MSIGNRIKHRRIELGLSADDLATAIGKDRATIYRYEKNEISKFPTEALQPIAKALKTTPAYLMGWEDDSSLKPKTENYSDHEKEVIAAYRAKPEMQSAVDTLLGVTEQEKIHPKTHERLHKVQIAAQNGKFEEKYMTDKEIQEIMNLPDIPDDDLL